jgi:5-methylcytosine-specific restriction enzyme subunit McrC
MTLRTLITFDELNQDGEFAEISDAQAIALGGTRLVETRPEPGGWRLVPTGRVGSVRIGDLQIDVRPKERVGLTRLLFLLGYARDPGWQPETVVAHRDDDLWPALAESLVRLTRAALGPGVLQGYRTVEESLRTVRGRIRIGDQITRRPGQMVPIEVTHDEFTVDIAENQILRSALRWMQGVPRLSDSARAGLGHLDGQLAGVSIVPPGTGLPEWRGDRRNARYVPALRLAEIALANGSAESGPEGLQMASFVVDMAKVYEDFVGTALTEALARYPGGTRLQYPSRLDVAEGDGRPGISMAVDIVHTVRSRPVLVFDAKYKAASATGAYPNADHYQMLAYCTALKVPTAWLVYANGPKGRRRIVNSDVTVMEHSLNLSAEPVELLAQMDAVAAAAWKEAEARAGTDPLLRPA